MGKLSVGKGGAYLFIEAISSMVSGYGFWIVLSKITTTEIIGTSSTVLSLATIVASIAAIGVPGGLQRFLAKSFAEEKREDAKVYIKASLLIVCLGILGSTIILFITKDWIYHVFKIDFILFVISISLIGSTVVSGLLRAIVIATLNTKIITIVSIVSTAAKISIAVILALVGTGVLGIIISTTIFPLISSILLARNTRLTIFTRSSNDKPKVSLTSSFKNIFVASTAFWIPGLITTIGTQLGTIVVFGTGGASQAGIYFIAISIVAGIALISSALSTIAYPAVSAMHDGRKRLSWRITKIASIAVIPLSSSIIFYSKDVMLLFGRGYVGGSSTLEILLLSLLPSMIVAGVGILVYSYAYNRQVLLIGLAVSLSRSLLYFVLVPIFGAIGAAITYTLGSVAGCIISIFIARNVGFQIFWKDIAIIMIIPTVLGFILSHTSINYILGIIVTILISFLLYLKLRIIDIVDLQDVFAIFPDKIANPALNVLTKVVNKLNRSSS